MTSAANRQPPSSGSSLLWSVGTLLAALAAAPVHWRAGILALLAGLGGFLLRGRSQVSAGLLTLGAAPLWVAATDELPGSALLLFAAALVLLHRRGLPRAVPWLVVAAAIIEALRLSILVPVLPASAALVWPILAGGCAVAGVASVEPGRIPALSLFASGTMLIVLALLSWLRLPTTPAEIHRAAEWGVLEHQPMPKGELAQVALEASPGWHALARTLPPSEALEVGWRPAGAVLGVPERVEVARLLERRGRGGEGLRLIKASADPALLWWRVLFSRLQGHPMLWRSGALPAEPVHRLPATLLLDLSLVHTGTTELLIHADTAVSSLSILLSGEWFEGPPELEIILDDRTIAIQVGPHRKAHDLGALTTGPHRLLLRFLNDLHGEDGDRNITVHTLTAE